MTLTTATTTPIDDDQSSQDRLSYVGQEITIPAGQKNSKVIIIKGRRGVGLNFPIMPAVVDFSIFVSPTNIELSEPNSEMALLLDQTFLASNTARKAFSSSFIAEHWYMQIVANVVEASEYKYKYTLT